VIHGRIMRPDATSEIVTRVPIYKHGNSYGKRQTKVDIGVEGVIFALPLDDECESCEHPACGL